MKALMLCLATMLTTGAKATADDGFYVQGDVVSPGRFAATGKETVRSAIRQAGGLAPTADEANIRLIRGGRVFRINDDPKADDRMRPGDRLVIYRKAFRPAAR